ncbi:MAG: hypothetical protein IPM51_07685 [Sphingobacteriaceae bacterium]|nr:hypothetical protein [Sphingobacteriaceae bacterium]
MRKISLLFLFVFASWYCHAQKLSVEDEHSFHKYFKIDELPRLLVNELNRFRISKGLDTVEVNEMMDYAAEMSAYKMGNSGKDKVDSKNTQKFLKKAGATKRGEEIAMKANVFKGRDDYPTADIAKVIYTKWENNKKNLEVLLNPKYTLVGIKAQFDHDEKKVFVSAIFGGYDILNNGVTHKKELAVKYNTKSKKLKLPEARKCKNCDRWRNYDILQQGAYVNNGKVYLKYHNSKELRRLIKKSTDGIAFDIVQREQYMKPDYNIVDNNLLNKGVMGKVIYRDQLFKKNLLINPKDKKSKKIKAIEVELGKFNKKIKEPYEINLLIVQDKRVCRTLTRGFTENGKIESNTPIGLLPVNGTSGLKPPFLPKSESSIINFLIPFEKNKFEFKDTDIQPFINALNEPDFIIDGLYIYAYSSIEGDSVANAKLQRKRAESVLNVLQAKQQNKIQPSIETRDSWGLFLLENEDGEYKYLVEMGKKQAIAKINSDKKLQDKLEPILAKERFAQIIMDVTYDVKGDKEIKFSKVSFDRALKAGNYPQTYKILEYIGKCVKDKKYPATLYDSLVIEDKAINAALLNNKVYYKYLSNNDVDEEDEATFNKLLTYEPANPVFQYNKIFCQIKLDSNAGKPEHQTKIQQTIDGFYGKLDSNLVNGLNIEWQFKIMESVDTSDNADQIIENCITRIKSFYNIKDASWQNALKLSYVFSRAKDFKYAATVLEPYIDKPDVQENLVFMYIASASRMPEKYYSRTFARALEIAKNLNKERYCKLFGEPFMTFQVLENVDVKRVYNASCR